MDPRRRIPLKFLSRELPQGFRELGFRDSYGRLTINLPKLIAVYHPKFAVYSAIFSEDSTKNCFRGFCIFTIVEKMTDSFLGYPETFVILHAVRIPR